MINPATAFKPSGLLGLAFATAVACNADYLAAAIGVPQTEADLALQIVDRSLIGHDENLRPMRPFLFSVVNDYARKSGAIRCDDFIYNAKLCYVPDYKVSETIYFLRTLRGVVKQEPGVTTTGRLNPTP